MMAKTMSEAHIGSSLDELCSAKMSGGMLVAT